MRRFDLGMSLNYVGTWGIVEAVREIFQNAFDAEVQNPENKMYFGYDKDTQTLHIGNTGGSLATSTLLLGSSSKTDDKNTIGKHGEGYKVATVVLKRLGKGVVIHNRGSKETWTAKVIRSRRYNSQVVVFDIEKGFFFTKVPNLDLVFEITGVSEDEYNQIAESNLHIHKAEKVYKGVGGDVLLDTFEVGRIYVGGLLVMRSKYANYGYNFAPSMVTLTRDRDMVDNIDLQFLCSKVLASTGEADLIYNARNQWDGKYIHFYINNYKEDIGAAIYDRAYNDFYKEHGEDAIPCCTPDEFNRLSKRGFHPVLLSDTTLALVTRSSHYSSPSYESDRTPEAVLSDLNIWLDSLLDRDDEDYKRGKALLDELADLL